MITRMVSSRRQITLPRDFIEHLGVQPGENIVLDKLSHGRIMLMAARPAGKISDVFGLLKPKGGASLSIGRMNRITARASAGRRQFLIELRFVQIFASKADAAPSANCPNAPILTEFGSHRVKLGIPLCP